MSNSGNQGPSPATLAMVMVTTPFVTTATAIMIV